MTRTGEGNRCPEEILAWIPWYPDGLDAEQRGAVEVHAAECAECRQELALVQGELEPGEGAPDAERLYARVLARIESQDDRDAGRGESRGAAAPNLARRGGWLVLAAGVLLALALGAVGGILLGSGTTGPPVYRTAGEVPGPAAAQSGVLLDVVFRSDVTALHINDAVRAVGGQIIDGPTRMGVYRMRIPADADAAAAIELLRGEGDGVAIFAELVRP